MTQATLATYIAAVSDINNARYVFTPDEWKRLDPKIIKDHGLRVVNAPLGVLAKKIVNDVADKMMTEADEEGWGGIARGDGGSAGAKPDVMADALHRALHFTNAPANDFRFGAAPFMALDDETA